LLTSYPTLEVEVHGFADPRGSSTFNLDLSQRRAEAVLAALKEGGVDEQRIHVNAHGKTMSTATVGDTEAFAWERRVSIAIKSSQSGRMARLN
jgi:outer membrane protein OmpA-like peptidoglycan-associated protein